MQKRGGARTGARGGARTGARGEARMRRGAGRALAGTSPAGRPGRGLGLPPVVWRTVRTAAEDRGLWGRRSPPRSTRARRQAGHSFRGVRRVVTRWRRRRLPVVSQMRASTLALGLRGARGWKSEDGLMRALTSGRGGKSFTRPERLRRSPRATALLCVQSRVYTRTGCNAPQAQSSS